MVSVSRRLSLVSPDLGGKLAPATVTWSPTQPRARHRTLGFAMADVASLFGGDTGGDAALFGGVPASDPYGQAQPAAASQGHWSTGYTPEGFQYWYNELTGESSWYPPAEDAAVTNGLGGAASYDAPAESFDSVGSAQPAASDLFGASSQPNDFFGASQTTVRGSGRG